MIRKNLYSILVALIIMYLSMASSHTFDRVPTFNIPHFDKIVHFGMYFSLMLVILIENRNTLKNFRQILLIGLASLSYGIIIEIMQSTLTVTRTGDFFDALADLTGIIAAILIWFLVIRYKKQAFRY